MMGSIYSGARQVIVWVGQDEDRCECGETWVAPSASLAFSAVCSVMNKWLAHNGRSDLVATYSSVSDNSSIPVEENTTMGNPQIIFGVDLHTLGVDTFCNFSLVAGFHGSG